MLGDEISDGLWDRLYSKLSGDTCPGCRQKLDRRHLEIQPCEDRVLVKCRRCGYAYLDNGNGVIIDINESDMSQTFESR
jgi:hypothetical protein